MTVGRVLLALLGIWVAIAVIGVIFKGLFWLFVLGLIAFGFTLAGGRKTGRLGGGGFLSRR